VRVALGELSARLGGELIGNPATVISRVSALESAGPDSISFLANPRYQAQMARSAAACVIVGPAMRDAAVARGAALVCAVVGRTSPPASGGRCACLGRH
jgi:UDP-3-O-[3-hydroxymyristoyl] glucosamine N-acyltransferase